MTPNHQWIKQSKNSKEKKPFNPLDVFTKIPHIRRCRIGTCQTRIFHKETYCFFHKRFLEHRKNE